MTTKTCDRYPGWDSHVRSDVAKQFGSLRHYAASHEIDVSDIPAEGRATAIKVWSRIVAHFGGTDAVAEDINWTPRQTA